MDTPIIKGIFMIDEELEHDAIKKEERIIKYWQKKKEKYKTQKLKDMCEGFIRLGINEIERIKSS